MENERIELIKSLEDELKKDESSAFGHFNKEFLNYVKAGGKIRGTIKKNYGAETDLFKPYYSVGPKRNDGMPYVVREAFRVESLDKLKELAKSQGYNVVHAGSRDLDGITESHYAFEKF